MKIKKVKVKATRKWYEPESRKEFPFINNTEVEIEAEVRDDGKIYDNEVAELQMKANELADKDKARMINARKAAERLKGEAEKKSPYFTEFDKTKHIVDAVALGTINAKTYYPNKVYTPTAAEEIRKYDEYTRDSFVKRQLASIEDQLKEAKELYESGNIDKSMFVKICHDLNKSRDRLMKGL